MLIAADHQVIDLITVHVTRVNRRVQCFSGFSVGHGQVGVRIQQRGAGACVLFRYCHTAATGRDVILIESHPFVIKRAIDNNRVFFVVIIVA